MAKLASKTVNVDEGTIVFEFADEQNVVVSVNDIPKDMQKRSLLHGLSQKLGDSYSGAESPEAAREQLNKVLEAIKEGNWNVGRTGGEGTPRVGALAKALARATGKTIEEATEVIESMDDEQKKALRAHPEVKKASAAIRAEEAEAAAKKASKDATPLADLLG